MQSDATIHIVDDEPDICGALSMLVRSVGYGVSSYPSADEFLARFRPGPPGCVLLDVRMPGMSGLVLQERLARTEGAPPVIIMTGHGDVPMAVRAMKAGAFDFIEKPFNDQALLDRVAEAVVHSRRRLDRAADRATVAQRYEALSPREREVMKSVVVGRLNKLIADDLGISVRTVEIHRAHIMEKMQAASLSALVRMALLLE